MYKFYLFQFIPVSHSCLFKPGLYRSFNNEKTQRLKNKREKKEKKATDVLLAIKEDSEF